MQKIDPIIQCPSCFSEIKLTDSLAAPAIDTIKKQYQEKMNEKELEISNREELIQRKELELRNAHAKIDEQVLSKVEQERTKIIAEEAKKAKLSLGNELETKAKEVLELQEIIKQKEEKLASAQQAQADLLKKQRELEDAKRELDLTVEKRINENLEQLRLNIKKEAEDEFGLKLIEKEQQISSMKHKIEELNRKAEQGSQQLQGEVQELYLEALLKTKFPFDMIEEVPKGEFGGDVIQKVFGTNAQHCGTILWESKRTKNWTDSWISKLKEDQRRAKAEIAVIVTQTLPDGVETFELINGVWVTSPKTIYPVTIALRQTLLEVAMARTSSEGQQTKMEIVYQYLTGSRFKQRIEAIVEAFTSMQEDLDKERKAIMKQWAKRDQQIERVMTATIGMYGDLQAIAGKSLQEIEGLELQSLTYDN